MKFNREAIGLGLGATVLAGGSYLGIRLNSQEQRLDDLQIKVEAEAYNNCIMENHLRSQYGMPRVNLDACELNHVEYFLDDSAKLK